MNRPRLTPLRPRMRQRCPPGSLQQQSSANETKSSANDPFPTVYGVFPHRIWGLLRRSIWILRQSKSLCRSFWSELAAIGFAAPRPYMWNAAGTADASRGGSEAAFGLRTGGLRSARRSGGSHTAQHVSGWACREQGVSRRGVSGEAAVPGGAGAGAVVPAATRG